MKNCTIAWKIAPVDSGQYMSPKTWKTLTLMFSFVFVDSTLLAALAVVVRHLVGAAASPDIAGRGG
jgi:hypothetical protein